jgi:hypothetical protein
MCMRNMEVVQVNFSYYIFGTSGPTYYVFRDPPPRDKFKIPRKEITSLRPSKVSRTIPEQARQVLRLCFSTLSSLSFQTILNDSPTHGPPLLAS